MLNALYGENQFHQLEKNPYMQIATKHFVNMHFHTMQNILNLSANDPNKWWFGSHSNSMFKRLGLETEKLNI